MDYGFKFEIGQTVKHAVAPARPKKNTRPWATRSEQRLLVVSRLLEECPGGIQRHYICRSGDSGGAVSLDFIRFNEVELVASEPFSEDAELDA